MLSHKEKIQLHHHKKLQRAMNTVSVNVVCSTFGLSLVDINNFKLPRKGRSRVYKSAVNLYCVSTRYPRDLDGHWELYKDQSFAKIYKTKLWISAI